MLGPERAAQSQGRVHSVQAAALIFRRPFAGPFIRICSYIYIYLFIYLFIYFYLFIYLFIFIYIYDMIIHISMHNMVPPPPPRRTSHIFLLALRIIMFVSLTFYLRPIDETTVNTVNVRMLASARINIS